MRLRTELFSLQPFVSCDYKRVWQLVISFTPVSSQNVKMRRKGAKLFHQPSTKLIFFKYCGPLPHATNSWDVLMIGQNFLKGENDFVVTRI